MAHSSAIHDLNKGVEYFYEAIIKDEIACNSAEISIVTFSDYATKVVEFDAIENQKVPLLEADGITSMGEGVELALDLLEERKREYSDHGVQYYQPWLVIMADGAPTDNIENAVKRAIKLQKDKKLTVFVIAMGEGADTKTLKRFSAKEMVLKVHNSAYFMELFEWLSQSVASTSQSSPGEKLALPQIPRVIEIDV
jgi:uncharacterized protein YegL